MYSRKMIIFLVAAAVALAVPAAHAEVTVESTVYGNSILLDLANESDEGISAIRVWLEDGNTIMSFKADLAWSGQIMQDGSVLLTAQPDLAPGERAKFGIIAERSPERINWQADDAEPGAIILVEEEPDPDPIFKIIPSRPNIGSTIRVVGQYLDPLTGYDFFINDGRVAAFRTDSGGSFTSTATIPLNLDPGRAEFRLGNDLTFSVNLSHAGGAEELPTGHVLTLDDLPDVSNRGDSVSFAGTAEPASQIVIQVSRPDGSLQNSLNTAADADGAWSAGPITISLDAPFGEYAVDVTDGRASVTKSWNVLSERAIEVRAEKTVLRPGEIIRFSGTALPDDTVTLSIENPVGVKVGAEIVTTNATGNFEFEYQTEQDSPLGSYTLIARQAEQIEFVHTSLGPTPEFDFNLELDKIAYMRDDVVKISISGDESDILNLRILRDKGRESTIEYHTQIQLNPEGRATHEVLLTSNYTEGTYTARLSKGNIGDEEQFGVDLGVKSADLTIGPVKSTYARGETILIIGNTLIESEASGRDSTSCDGHAKNIQIEIRLVDPSGNVVRTKPTFIDSSCLITDNSFKVPDDAELGTWNIVSNIKNDAAVFRSGTFAGSGSPGTQLPTGPAYDGCVPAATPNKWVILACKIDVRGDNPKPVLRLVNDKGSVVWEKESNLANEIFDALGETEGVIQNEPVKSEEPSPKATSITFDHNCENPVSRPSPSNTTQSNQTTIDLLGIETVSCPYDTRYNDALTVCSKPATLKHNASSIDIKKTGPQKIVYTCGDDDDDLVTAVRTVYMIDDENPKIRILEHTDIQQFWNYEYKDPGATCIDNADKNPVLEDNAESLDVSDLGSAQKVTYTCTDESGNKDTKVRTVRIVDPLDIESHKNPQGEIGRTILFDGEGNSGLGLTGGSTLIRSPFEVIDIYDRTLKINTESGIKVGSGEIVEIVVSGAERDTIITIEYEDGKIIQEYTIKESGNEIVYHWLVPRTFEPGVYTITATDGDKTAEIEYVIPLK